MNLNDALVIMLVLFGTALTACVLFLFVAGPERGQLLLTGAGILAGAFGGVLAFLKSQKGGGDDDDRKG